MKIALLSTLMFLHSFMVSISSFSFNHFVPVEEEEDREMDRAAQQWARSDEVHDDWVSSVLCLDDNGLAPQNSSPAQEREDEFLKRIFGFGDEGKEIDRQLAEREVRLQKLFNGSKQPEEIVTELESIRKGLTLCKSLIIGLEDDRRSFSKCLPEKFREHKSAMERVITYLFAQLSRCEERLSDATAYFENLDHARINAVAPINAKDTSSARFHKQGSYQMAAPETHTLPEENLPSHQISAKFFDAETLRYFARSLSQIYGALSERPITMHDCAQLAWAASISSTMVSSLIHHEQLMQHVRAQENPPLSQHSRFPPVCLPQNLYRQPRQQQ